MAHYNPDTINWELGGQIYIQLDKYALRFVTRYIYQRLPLHGAAFQKHPTTLCPICKKNAETFEHFNTCIDNKETWKEMIPILTQIYNKHKVDPALRVLINTVIMGDSTHDMIAKQEHPWDEYSTLIQEQRKIGWSQLRLGRYSNQWTWHQYKYASQFDKRHTTSWLYQVIKKTWVHASLRWDYRNNTKFLKIK